ncbi:hypothetical protein CLF_102466 [Clonorchis sinensis]|uniref:Uncharacterized protein n=1 Tax=Clonorchis sinensis TaxID=79923 RepID=G7Y801_CLOSI|nr:hypothetical protein CLF_102466 [Clonorchis sinensis]
MKQPMQLWIFLVLSIGLPTTLSLVVTLPVENANTTVVERTKRNQTEAVCTDFLEILADHMIGRATRHIDDPVLIGDIRQTFFGLSNGRLYGLRSLQRTCPIQLEHEEVWIRSNLSHPNMNIQLEQWKRKQDEKVADILHLSLCLGIPKSLQLRGSLVVSSLWETYGPEVVRITISDISIRTRVTLHLNRTGKMEAKLSHMFVERLNRITFEEDQETNKDVIDPLDIQKANTKSSSGIINRLGSLLDWLANGPLYTPLVIMLEGSLRDSFRSLLEEKTKNW